MNKYLLTFLFMIVYYFVPHIKQDVSYHNFADSRTMLGVPNCLDTLSNIAFLLVGLYGFYKRDNIRNSYITPVPHFSCKKMYDKNRFCSNVFFAGVVLTCFGSMYYHLNPNNTTLVLDRLPMAITFMALLTDVLQKNSNRIFSTVVQTLFIMFGIVSVVWWCIYDDLKLYIVCQFGSLLYVVYSLYINYNYKNSNLLQIAISFYILAKLFEMCDTMIYSLTYCAVSGHTLKHIVAAIGAFYAGKFVDSDFI